MLIGEVTIGPSRIDGVGVFTKRALPKGTVIWGPCRGCASWSPAQVPVLGPSLHAWLEEFGYRTSDAGLLLPCQYAHLMNHSCDPNVLDFGADFGLAVRDIEAGEELALDYGTFCDDEEWTLTCRCGSSRCRLTISSRDGTLASVRASWSTLLGPARKRASAVPQPLEPVVADISPTYRALRRGANLPLEPSVSVRAPAFLSGDRHPYAMEGTP